MAETLDFADSAAWEGWLEEHHATTTEAWLRIAKQHAPVDRLRIADLSWVT